MTDLYDQIKSETEELEAEIEKENEDESATEEKSSEDEVEEKADEEAEGEGSSEEGTDDDSDESGEKETVDSGDDSDGEIEVEAKKTDEDLTNSDWARLRREKKALERKLEEVESVKVAPVVETQPVTSNEPDRTESPAEWLEWNDQRIEKELNEMKEWKAEQQQQTEQQELYKRASAEFTTYERAFEKDTPDYDEATKHYVSQLTNGMKMLQPHLSKEQLGQAVTNHLFQQAGEHVAKGLNPAEELYHTAKDNGYVPKEVEVEKKSTEKKVNLKKIDNNRKRSATGLSGRGSDNSTSYTLEEVANMSNGELANLDPNIIRQLEMDE